MTVLHLRGVFLPDETERDAWIVGGRLTFTRPFGDTDTVTSGGWVLPGFVDMHAHIGLSPTGHDPAPEVQATQALRHREAGDYSAPLQLMAKRLSFVDPISGAERSFSSGLELENGCPTLSR